jgi:hypothetical protein
MNSAVSRRLLGSTLGLLAIGAAVAPAAYAGEDGDGGDGTTTHTWTSSDSGGGSGDSGSASGGVAAGAGGMSVAASKDMIVPELLAGTGVLVLSAAGLAFRRRSGLQAETLRR